MRAMIERHMKARITAHPDAMHGQRGRAAQHAAGTYGTRCPWIGKGTRIPAPPKAHECAKGNRSLDLAGRHASIKQLLPRCDAVIHTTTVGACSAA